MARVNYALVVGTFVLLGGCEPIPEGTLEGAAEKDGEINFNEAPVAAANGRVGDTVLQSGAILPIGAGLTLDGSQSSDADGNALTYRWRVVSQPAGSTLDLSNTTVQMPNVDLREGGDYTFELVVNDGWESSTPVTISFSAAYTAVTLDFGVIDAEYSDSLDRIVMISANPARLKTFAPATGQFTDLELPLTPTSVSVGPSGKTAAVGHNEAVSHIDLSQNLVTSTLAVSTDVSDVVLADNGYIYSFPRTGQHENIYSTEIATGAETLTWGIYDGTKAKLQPGTQAIYGADNGLSPSDIEKYSIAAGPAEYLYDSPYHGDYDMCGDLWFSEDGNLIFTACGNVFATSSVKAEDMVYSGSLDMRVASLDHSQQSGVVAAITGPTFSDPDQDATVSFFTDNPLSKTETSELPRVLTSTGAPTAHGKYIFLRSDGLRHFVIAQGDNTETFAIFLSDAQ